MSREWKPGTVLTDSDGAVFFVVGHAPVDRNHPLYTEPCVVDVDGNGWRVDTIEGVRPLVVIDLPQGARAGWPTLITALRTAQEKTGLHLTFGGLIDQIEAQTRPPKPPEPTGHLAVVEDAAGVRWVNWKDPRDGLTVHEHPWQSSQMDTEEWRDYADINAVRVLSEGVTA